MNAVRLRSQSLLLHVLLHLENLLVILRNVSGHVSGQRGHVPVCGLHAVPAPRPPYFGRRVQGSWRVLRLAVPLLVEDVDIVVLGVHGELGPLADGGGLGPHDDRGRDGSREGGRGSAGSAGP